MQSRIQKWSYADLAAKGPPANAITAITFMRDDVEKCNIREFTSAFDVQQMSSDVLRKFMGKCRFDIDGYNEDPRELPIIPEVRTFYRALYKAWPYWFFFAAVDTTVIVPMVLAYLSPALQIRLDQPFGNSYGVDSNQINDFLHIALTQMNVPWNKSGLPENALKERWNQIYSVFGFSQRIPV